MDQGYFGWGATFLDGDLDGDLDLAATNGWRSGGFETDPSRYFESPGGGSPFVDASSAVGFDDTRWGSSLLAADLDRDGDLDLIQGCMDGDLRVLENEPADGGEPAHWLVVRPRASGANRHAAILARNHPISLGHIGRFGCCVPSGGFGFFLSK